MGKWYNKKHHDRVTSEGFTECNPTGKIRFPSEASASKRIAKYKEIQRAYFCEECKGFHLTSKEKTDPRKKVEDSDIEARMRELQDKLKENDVHKL
jgi:hypothetical protein